MSARDDELAAMGIQGRQLDDDEVVGVICPLCGLELRDVEQFDQHLEQSHPATAPT